jgi:hypothetical protein
VPAGARRGPAPSAAAAPSPYATRHHILLMKRPAATARESRRVWRVANLLLKRLRNKAVGAALCRHLVLKSLELWPSREAGRRYLVPGHFFRSLAKLKRPVREEKARESTALS